MTDSDKRPPKPEATAAERVAKESGFTVDENPSSTLIVGGPQLLARFRFLLRDAATGEAAGEFLTSATSRAGDVFTAEDGRRLRIVDILPVDVSSGRQDAAAVWLVEPATE